MTEKPFQAFDNLRETHAYEEKLRNDSMALIVAGPELHKRFALVEKAMALIFAYTHEHSACNEDERTIQMLGIRTFNAAASAIKLGLSGYYQTAFAQVRDIMEVGFLLDLFRTSPEKIAEWKGADDASRQKIFAPFRVRDALDKRDGNKERKRAAQYKILSEYGTHATYRGFRMTMRGGIGELGPFVEKVNLQAFIEEMVLRLGPTAAIFANLFPNARTEFEDFRRNFGTELVTGIRKDPERSS